MLQTGGAHKRSLPAPPPVIALAHSMGAHILLRYLHDHPRRIRCAVLLAPRLDVHTGKYSPQQVRVVTTVLNLRKPSTRFVFGVEERDPLDVTFEDKAVTPDRTRFERTQAFI